MNEKELPERLKQLRKDRGINRRQLSEAIGVPYSTIDKYESGRHRIPQDFIKLLAEYYGIPTDEVLGITQSEPEPERVIDYDRVFDALRELGFVSESHKISETDIRFLKSMISQLNTWFD